MIRVVQIHQVDRFDSIRVEERVFQGPQFAQEIRNLLDAIVLHIEMGQIDQMFHGPWQTLDAVVLQC